LGDAGGYKAVIEVLLAGRSFQKEAIVAGLEAAIEMGSVDPAIVVVEARRYCDKPTSPVIEIASASRFDRPAPSLDGYDELLQAQS
jgi:hypothetical protein